MSVSHRDADGVFSCSSVFCAWVLVFQCVLSFLLASVSSPFWAVSRNCSSMEWFTWCAFLDLSEILDKNQIGSQWKRKEEGHGSRQVCCLYNYTALLCTAACKCKRVAMQGLTSSKYNFNPLQQNQQPERFIMAIQGLLIVIFSDCGVVQELHG